MAILFLCQPYIDSAHGCTISRGGGEYGGREWGRGVWEGEDDVIRNCEEIIN